MILKILMTMLRTNLVTRLGNTKGSPDYIDEELLRSLEVVDKFLSDAELEQKRLEAAQYKLEGNALYLEEKTREALGETFW